MDTKNFLIVIFLIVFTVTQPSHISNSQPYTIKPEINYIDSPKRKDIDLLQQENIKLNRELKNKLNNFPKVIYKTRKVKPDKITIYIRDYEGNLSEHVIKSDKGYFIIDIDDFIESTDSIVDKSDIKRKYFKRKK